MQRGNARLSQRIAQEAQLLAEEKWIIETLKKLKQQRNSLQIERLHLENLRATWKNKLLRNEITAQKPSDIVPGTSSEAPTSQVLQQAAPQEEQTVVTTLSQFDVPVAGIDDEMCNNVKLNLSVTDSVFKRKDKVDRPQITNLKEQNFFMTLSDVKQKKFHPALMTRRRKRSFSMKNTNKNSNQQLNTLDMEEDEEDLDNGLEDEEDMENTLIDMNMLMQAKPR